MLSDKKNIIFIVILFVAVTLFFIFRGNSGNTASYDLSETGLTVGGPDSYSYTFEFADVSSAELVTEFDEGTCLSGGTSNNYTYGTWNNSDLGDYNVCKLTKVSTCIEVQLKDNSYFVFNMENATTTTEFYDNLLKYIN